ncbi:hypothetical protein D3C75_769910 [compost metagenome]
MGYDQLSACAWHGHSHNRLGGGAIWGQAYVAIFTWHVLVWFCSMQLGVERGKPDFFPYDTGNRRGIADADYADLGSTRLQRAKYGENDGYGRVAGAAWTDFGAGTGWPHH